jgi:pyridinium-3,5-biscarboxylic acid mononucleotide sulfurtransferase
MRTMSLEEKERALAGFIGQYRTAIVAFSGGVDSSYLAFVAHQVLGERARAVTGISPSVSERQRELVEEFVRKYSLNHTVINTGEMENPSYTGNPSNRCYFCKSELFDQLNQRREEWNLEVIFDGSNSDDVGDYRPGRQAAGEQKVVSPFIEVGLSKDDIRQLSRKAGLPTWDLPAMPCLSSRFPYGVEITEDKLRQVDKAESFLRDLGFRNFRVRHHEDLARIEVDKAEMADILDATLLDVINREFRSFGYHYVTLDLQGFRSGSLNELLQLETLPRAAAAQED